MDMNKIKNIENTKVKCSKNHVIYYMFILQDCENDNLYYISISTEKIKLKYKLEKNKRRIMKVLFQIRIDESINPLNAEKIIHDYLKEKGFYIKPNWFLINDDNEIIDIANSMLKIGSKIE